MKNYFLLLVVLMITLVTKAQMKVGNNPSIIGTSSLLELESPTKALLLTRVHDTTKIAVPVNGMLIYDSSTNSVQARQGGYWIKLFSLFRQNQPATLLPGYRHLEARLPEEDQQVLIG